MPDKPTTGFSTEDTSSVQGPTRWSFLALGAATAGALATGSFASAQSTKCIDILERPTAKRPDPQPNQRVYSDKETLLAFRNHGHFAEFLDQP